jgi:hypothetical protein
MQIQKSPMNREQILPTRRLLTGSIVVVGVAAWTGAQKATIAEQFIRSEGYDMSLRIDNVMIRSEDVLDVMRL